MRKAVLVFLIAFALVPGFTAIADAAPTAAYKVTLTTTTTSEAGKFVAVSGKVTGPQAAGKSVTIQRRYVGGPWTTVAVATTKKNGSYSARVETPRGGSTSFRALKAKSSARKTGTSPTRTVKVFEWLYLANQGGSVQDMVVRQPYEQKIGGSVYKRSIAIQSDGQMMYKLNGLCTQLTTRAAYLTNDPTAPASTVDLKVLRSNGAVLSTKTSTIALNAATTITSSLAGMKYLGLDIDGLESGNRAVLGDPRVYCNADRLPSLVDADLH